MVKPPKVPRRLPPLPETVIPRPRLLAQLGKIHTHKLTLITAQPGYGKTTLVAQYLEQSDSMVAWHAIEPRERDLPNLFEHCVSVLGAIVPGTASLKFRPQSTPDELATQITEHLRQVCPIEEVIYVLDDAHELLGSLAGEAWARAFVKTLPENWHVVMIGRQPPNLLITDMVARGEVFALQSEQLRFTYEEINDLASRLGTKPSASQIENVEVSLAGWPAGTILALQPLPNEAQTALLTGETGAEALFAMMATSVLDTLSPVLRHFLLVSSTLRIFTPELCKKVLDLRQSTKNIAEAQARHLFISHVHGGLVYHPLFRDVLQKQFRETDSQAFSDLHVRAGQWYEQQQSFEEAFDHYVAADQLNRAATLAEMAAQAYYSEGKVETVLGWGRKLTSVSNPCPRTHYTCAMIHTIRQQYDDAEHALEQAAQGFEVQQDRTGSIQVQLLQATICNQRGEHAQAIKLADQFAFDTTVPENLRGLALVTLGIAHFQIGKTTSALQHLETALPIYRTVNDVYSTSQLLQHLELAYLRVGRFDEATVCVQEMSSIHRNLGNTTGLAYALNNLGYHYHLAGLYQQARESFQEGLSIATCLSDKRVEAYLLSSMANLLYDRDAWDDALSLYQKALELIGRDEPVLRCSLLLGMSTLARWQGEKDEALALAQEAFELAQKHQITVAIDKAELLILAVRIRFDESPVDTRRLMQIVSSFQKQQAVSELMLAYGIAAHYQIKQSHPKEATAFFRRALSESVHPTNLHLLIAEIAHNDNLYQMVNQQPLTYQALLKRVEQLQKSRISSAESAPQEKIIPPTYSLRVMCLGQERLERDGQKVDPAAWKGKLAREIFYYLLFHGPTEREALGLHFWPDSTSQQVRDNFHTQVRRARQTVGQNAIDLDSARYFINPQLDVWCDAFEFEKLVKKARLMPPRQPLVENLWRQAIDLNQGELLPALDADWILSRREEFHQMYSQAILGLANSLQLRECWHEAILILKRGLERDPLSEEMHRSIMVCYARLGQKQQVARQFDELKKLLHQELGIAPSSETIHLVQKLLH